ncbi:MAG TPA: hypothetical protein G4O10_09790 [Dehalococcoidia bacterium]|nr:hypothetical protein [Dehalococcoidia bacterium]
MAKPSCFIILPLTVPDSLLTSYRDGAEHFIHVLDCLFLPAVDKAGYEPIKPIAKGADLIHAEIIRHLECSDIVLCDMSTLHPNVFFEFGIRTSLNKPVCIVKDELTTHVPFDTGILNYYQYSSAIEPWTLDTEIDHVAAHISTSAERSNNENPLWKYFGFRAEAAPYETKTDTDSKLDYLIFRMNSLGEQIDNVSKQTMLTGESLRSEQDFDIIMRNLIGRLGSDAGFRYAHELKDGSIEITYSGYISPRHQVTLINLAKRRYGIDLSFSYLEPRPKKPTNLEDVNQDS